jgi:hypothetical protein
MLVGGEHRHRRVPRCRDAALDGMDPPGHRPVGWSIPFALARAQLRRLLQRLNGGKHGVYELAHPESGIRDQQRVGR